MQLKATRYNTLQHAAIHVDVTLHTVQKDWTVANYNRLQQTATHCNTLQHAATHMDVNLNTVEND